MFWFFLVGALAVGAAVLAVVTIKEIEERAREEAKKRGLQEIGAKIEDAIEKEEYTEIDVGLYDTRTNQKIGSMTIKGKEVDKDVAKGCYFVIYSN